MAETAKPTVVLLFGDDELALQERLAELIARLGDPASAESNVARFAAARLDLAALEAHLYSMPFLASRRMAVLELGEAAGRAADFPDRFYRILEGLPSTSVLVAIERLDYAQLGKGSGRDGPTGEELIRAHETRSPFFRWVQAHSDRAVAREHRTPRGPAFERWLASRAGRLGGEIGPEAAALLREYTAEDTRLADQELRKLIDYADAARPIQRRDVEGLTPFHAETNIFAVVDALGTRDGTKAVRILNQILEEEDPRYVFGMVARQVRLLVLARSALDDGRSPGDALSASPHHVRGFAAERIGRQALAFSMPQLKGIYRELFALDLASKTGRADLEVGLESLVAALAR